MQVNLNSKSENIYTNQIPMINLFRNRVFLVQVTCPRVKEAARPARDLVGFGSLKVAIHIEK